MKNVGLYVRVSTQEQAERGWSIEGQLAELHRFCDAREGWKVRWVLKDPGEPTVEWIRTKRLVVAAGTLGTAELLLKSSEKGQPNRLDLSAELGKRFSTDGDLLGYVSLENLKVDSTRGPINTCHAMFRTQDKDFAFSIEDAVASRTP